MEYDSTSTEVELPRVLPGGAGLRGTQTAKDQPMKSKSKIDTHPFEANDPLADLLGSPINPNPSPAPSNQISETELADLLGLTANRIRTLTRDGIVKRTGKATYDRREAVRSYAHALREALTKKGHASKGGDAMAAEKLRLATALAEKAERANAAARGDLIPASDVAREWAGVLRGVRAGLLALPSRVGSRLGHLTPHDLSEIDLEVRATLNDLSESEDGSD
jgi:phage terminase Nu1 subunit (DNA packaging protein)